MKAVKQGILSAALALTSISAVAGPFYIGQAADFNAYIMEDMQGTHSDVEGRLAVGGNLTLDNYGLGLQLNEQGSKPVFVGGGDARMRDSRVYNGDAVAAGTIDINETVGLYNDPDTHNTNAFYQDSSGRHAIRVRQPAADGMDVLASRSHGDADALQRLLAGRRVRNLINAGSSLKLCLIAAGKADLYPRQGRTMEWDIAAGHAVLAAAGGQIQTFDGAPLLYGKPGFENPHFVASGGLPFF